MVEPSHDDELTKTKGKKLKAPEIRLQRQINDGEDLL